MEVIASRVRSRKCSPGSDVTRRRHCRRAHVPYTVHVIISEWHACAMGMTHAMRVGMVGISAVNDRAFMTKRSA